MKKASKIFLKQLFREYYFINAEKILEEVEEISQREVAYIPFEARTMIRHIGVKGEEELIKLIVEKTPMHLYHSAAYYLFPEREMEKKNLIGCDLIFDIDVDQLVDEEGKVMRLYLCDKCDEVYRAPLEACEVCGGGLGEVEWISEADLQVAKKEVSRLYKALIDEFGISQEDVKVYFSGSRGYHVHVTGENVRDMETDLRMEIVDYLKLVGYDLRYERNDERRTFKTLLKVLTGGDNGFLRKLSESERFEIENLSKKARKRNLREVLREMSPGLRLKVEEHIKRREGIGIDPVVTTDVHRLIRFPRSIHGGSGLVKERVKDVEEFAPFKHAVKLSKEMIDVYVRFSPKFSLIDEEYGPFSREKVSLPGYAAAFLICRGLAEVE